MKLLLASSDTSPVILFPHGYAEATTQVVTLKTPRLWLRGWRSSDMTELKRLRSDPDIAPFIPMSSTSPDSLVGQLESWARLGYGSWALELKATGQFVGTVGLALPGHWPSTEMTWLIDKRFWNQGLATEAARAAVGYAFDFCNIHELIAVCTPDNLRSERVMQKLGMQKNDIVTCAKRSIPITQYSITPSGWRSAS